MAFTAAYIDGCEHGVISTAGGGLATTKSGAGIIQADSGLARSGAYSYRIITTGNQAGYDMDTGIPSNRWEGMFAFLLATTTSTTVNFFQIQSSGDNGNGMFQIDSSLRLIANFWNGGGYVGSVAGPTIIPMAWTVVKFSMDFSSTTWTIKWEVDGVTQTDAVATAQASARTPQLIDIGAFGGNNTIELNIDDIVVGYGSVAEHPIDTHKVLGYSPNAVGTHNLDAATSAHFFKDIGGVETALTTSETTSYQQIDNVPMDSESDHILVKAVAGGAPATPAFRSAGATTFSANNVTNTSLTPGAPAGKAVGDLLVLIASSTSNGMTVTTPTGWTLLTNFPKASGTAVGGKVYAFVRVADGTATDTPAVTFASLTTGTSGTPANVTILAFTDLTVTQDATATSSDLSAQTTTSLIPSVTAATNNSMVIGVALKMLESSGQTSTVATFTERKDAQTTSGIGNALEISTLVKTTAGATGTATVTWSATGSARAFTVTFALQAAVGVTQPTNTWYAEYAFADSAESVPPFGVRIIFAHRHDTAVTSHIEAKLWGDGFDLPFYVNDTSHITDQYASLVMQAAPSGFPWTTAIFNALTLKWGFTNSASGTPRLVEAMLQAAFPETAPPATEDVMAYIGGGYYG